MHTFGELLKAAREKAGLRQEQLAAKAGLTQAALSHLEAGHRQPSWDTVQRLTIALGLKVKHPFTTMSKPGEK